MDLTPLTFTAQLTPLRLAPDQIVSNEDQHILLNTRSIMSKCFWDISDVCDRTIQHASEAGVPVTNMRVYEAVGYFVAREARTIRYYHETGRFFPPAVRKEYDMLDFAYFVVARSFGEQWQEVLEWAAVNPQASAQDVRGHFLSEQAALQAARASELAQQQHQEQCADDELAAEIEQCENEPAAVPPPEPDKATVLFGAVEKLIGRLNTLTGQLGISRNLRLRLAQALSDVSSVMVDIAEEINTGK